MNICSLIKELTDYGMKKGLVEPADEIYTVNRLLELFNINEYTPDGAEDDTEPRQVHLILNDMLDYAVSEGMIEDTITNRDLFDTKIMGYLLYGSNKLLPVSKKAFMVNRGLSFKYMSTI